MDQYSLSRREAPLKAALAPLLVGLPPPSDSDLLAELSKVMGVTDAIALHGLLRGAARKPGESRVTSGSVIKSTVLVARQSQRDFIANSFEPEPNEAPFTLPSLDEPPGYDGLTGAQRLQRFYARHQQEMEMRVQSLRGQVRQGLARLAPALAQLAELDEKIGQVVTAQLGRAFAVIPAHLAKYCEQCRRDAGGNWQQSVAQLTQTLLLAELDVRLEPVFGLVEATE